MKFNHLNVPSHWQNYWTRYPEGHTILEALISWVSQVDSMVDNQNKLNDNVEQFRNEIDAFIGRFDDRLQDEVTRTLTEWQTSGFLNVVISEALQWELDNYIATNEQDKLSLTTQLQQTEQSLNAQLAQTTKKIGWVSPLDFGAVGDGVTDDTQAIQDTLIYAFENNKNVTSTTLHYAISSTIIIPQNPTFLRNITIDFGNSIFHLLNDVTLFTSGYEQNGSLISNYGTTLDSNMSFGIKLGNFGIKSEVGQLTSPTLIIQDYHQGSVISNIKSNDTQQILKSRNSYYTTFENIETILSHGNSIQSRFYFDGSHNLCTFYRLVAGNAGIGMEFNGGITACQFNSLSLEGQQIGMQFNQQVFDCVIENCYIEGIEDVALKFGSYVNNTTIRNNYVNYIDRPTMYFIEYLPGPLNNIIVEQDNAFVSMSDDSFIFKTKDNTPGYNQLTFKRPATYTTSKDALLVDNANFSEQFNIIQHINIPRAKAHLVNRFAVGNYSGRFTGGYTLGIPATTWVDNSNNIFTLETKFVFSDTQRIYVNVRLVVGGAYKIIKGEFIGRTFYEFDTTGVTVTNALSISTVDGFQVIESGDLGGLVTKADGEVRLI